MTVAASSLRAIALATVAIPLSVAAIVPASLVLSGEVAAQQRQQVFINRVYFEGNDKAKDDQLSNVTASRARGVYDPAVVQADIERIRNAYNVSIGRANAAVTARTVQITPTTVDVVFTIVEGDKVGIEEIRFVGNSAFSAFRLKRQMQTTESGLFGWLRTTDTYDPVRLESDAEAIRRYYNARGYPDFQVLSVDGQLNAGRDGYVVTITVDEGARYAFGTARVESNLPGVDGAELERVIQTSSGGTYNAALVDRTIEDMTDVLGRRGYPFAQVRPRGERDAAGNIVNVTYVIEDGAPVYVERINIRGNSRTRDNVIRREFDMAEGDGYSQVEVDRAVRRLNALGFFDAVRVTTEPGSAPDRVVVNVDVMDKATGEFTIGGGWSTTDGFIGEASVTERNFLGRGQYLKVGVQWGEKKSGYDFSFIEPYFMDQRIAVGFDLYSRTEEGTSYNYVTTKTVGGALKATFPITDNLSVAARYQLFSNEYSLEDATKNNCPPSPPNPAPAPGAACLADGEVSLAFKEQLGRRWVSALGYTVRYTTLDSPRNPTEGLFVEFNQDLAGLGGDAQWLKTGGQVRYYYPIMDDLTLMLRAQGGHVASLGKRLLIADHFNIGPDLVRGFAPGGLSPRDLAGGGRGNPLGGTIYYGGTAELQFPLLGLPREAGLSGALFVDAGTLYGYDGVKLAGMNIVDSSTIRASVGASLLWASPFGPLRFDFAHVIAKESFDETQTFRFSGGTSF